MMVITKYNGVEVAPGTTINDLPLHNGDVITSSGLIADGDGGDGVWDVVFPHKLESDGVIILNHDGKGLVRRFNKERER